MILKSEFNGVITSIPPNKVAFRGKSRIAPIEIRIPNAAVNAQAAAGRLANRPIESTTSAVRTTTASGEANLRSTR